MEKKSGILLHPTSLPSPYGIGDLGQGAYQFLDFLAETHQRIWQILPLTPPDDFYSPYQCLSAFAANPLLISPGKLQEEGLLEKEHLDDIPSFPEDKVDFGAVIPFKEALLQKACRNFAPQGPFSDFPQFLSQHQDWLPGYALFMALRDYFEKASWSQWPQELVRREKKALDRYREKLKESIQDHFVIQYLFFRQWERIRRYAEERKIEIMGDLPIFVAYESSDVWENPQLFTLNSRRKPAKVAGVPPDYFSATGQRWGNPLYRWDKMAEDDYSWWRRRVKNLLTQVHSIRIDHFRGFEAYWEIDAREKTAEKGRWVKGPGETFFRTLEKYLGRVPVVAEDLGLITCEVIALRKKLGYPGMKVLQFAIEGGEKELKKVLQEEDILLYTGTHDNDTLLGWYKKALQQDRESIAVAEKVLGIKPGLEDEELCWKCIEEVFKSRAGVRIFPLQDILALGEKDRMNTPGTFQGNWAFRFQARQINPLVTQRLKTITQEYC